MDVAHEVSGILFPKEKRECIANTFMTLYNEQMDDEVLDHPRRSVNGSRSDLYYWHDTSTPIEDQMAPFMRFALMYFPNNGWIHNWMNTFYDENGDMHKEFHPIIS
jgi:hypothetical protein